MESCRVCVIVCVVLLSCTSADETYLPEDEEVKVDSRALRNFYPKEPNLTSQKELLGALQEVLKKLQTKRVSLWEKKFSLVPTVIKELKNTWCLSF
ncbi:cocaine- and amphetamine-regulated transcript protein-like isoform X2 [Trichomycterus rosablanca]|uniref:cocaine- and amphetamine-regulated transcript protein-like isoform X2 n=1 Tax=Trichomycterus rosablanca TaxID=2290929 RepID=UPI002F34FD57